MFFSTFLFFNDHLCSKNIKTAFLRTMFFVMTSCLLVHTERRVQRCEQRKADKQRVLWGLALKQNSQMAYRMDVTFSDDCCKMQ